MPATMRPRVDLPQPDSPTSPTTSPLRTARSTPSTARTTSSFSAPPQRGRARAAPAARRGRSDLPKRLETPRSSMIGDRRGHAAASAIGWKQRSARPGTGSGDRRALRAQASSARGQRGAEGAARRAGSSSDGVMPGICVQPAAAAVAAGHAADQARGVGMQRAVEHGVDRRPVSTMRPAYITAISSASPATTERSWVIQISAVPLLARQLLHLGQDLRLDGDVERGGRLVGDDQVGPVQQRDGDRHALAHAAGELVRIGARAARRGSGCPPCPAHRAPGPAPRRGRRARARAPSRSSASSMRRTGLSVIIGSWKIMAMRLPRSARSCGSGSVVSRGPGSGCCRAAMRPGGSTRPMMEKPVTVLPQPDSPTSPSTRPRARRERNPVHRLHHAARGCRTRCAGRSTSRVGLGHRCSRGFSTSRNSSPTRLMATMVTSSAMPG